MHKGPWTIKERIGHSVYDCICTCGLHKEMCISEIKRIKENSVCTHIVDNTEKEYGKKETN